MAVAASRCSRRLSPSGQHGDLADSPFWVPTVRMTTPEIGSSLMAMMHLIGWHRSTHAGASASIEGTGFLLVTTFNHRDRQVFWWRCRYSRFPHPAQFAHGRNHVN